METKYIKLLTLAAICGAGVDAYAQQDSTLNRELILEKAYNPVIRDADKINRLPDVDTIQIAKSATNYSERNVPATPSPEVVTLSSANVKTYHDFSRKRGYAMFGLGNYMNMAGALGYRFVDKPSDVFGFMFNHQSTHGTLDYIDSPYEVKQKYNDEYFKLYYNHQFASYELKTGVSYDYTGFNYYGSTLIDGTAEGDHIIDNPLDNQKQNRVDVYMKLSPTRVMDMAFRGDLGVAVFSNDIPDFSETNIRLGFGMDTQMNHRWRFSGDVNFSTLIYGNSGVSPEFWLGTKADAQTVNDVLNMSDSEMLTRLGYDGYDNTGVLSLAPGVIYNNGSRFNVRLGLRLDFGFGLANHFGVAPDIKLDYQFANGSQFYANATGGLRQYTLNQSSKEILYYLSNSQAKNSYDIVDLELGYRSNSNARFWYEVYAGFGFTSKERVLYSYISDFYSAYTSVSESPRNTNINSVMVSDDNAAKGKAGVNMKYMNNNFEAGMKFQLNAYSSDKVRSGRAGVELGVDASYRVMKPLLLEAEYNLMASRKVYVEEFWSAASDAAEIMYKGEMRDLKSINEFNIHATYSFNDWISVKADINNIFNQKYDIWYGMPSQGFHFMIGAAAHF